MDAEEKHDDSQEGLKSLASSLKVSFAWLYLLVAIMLLTIAGQSVVIVKPHEKAAVFRFGELRGVLGTGLHFTLPYPVEETEVFDAGRTRQIESNSFMFEARGGEIPPSLKPGTDGFLISSDRSIIHAKCSLSYTVDASSEESLAQYFLLAEDGGKILKTLLDNAVLKAAAQLPADETLLNTDRLKSKIASELRGNLDSFKLGIIFEGRDVSVTPFPPRQAKAAFDALNQANQNKEKELNDAFAYKIKTEREAQLMHDTAVAEAKAEMLRKIAQARSDAETFSKRRLQYEKNPDLIAKSIYDDTLFRILEQVQEKIVIEKGDRRQLRILIGRSAGGKDSAPEKDE